MCTLDPFVGGRRPCAVKITRHWPGREVRKEGKKGDPIPCGNLLFETEFTWLLSHPSFLLGSPRDVACPPAGGVRHQPCLSWCEMQAMPPVCSKGLFFLIFISPFPFEPGAWPEMQLLGQHPNPLDESCQPLPVGSAHTSPLPGCGQGLFHREGVP